MAMSSLGLWAPSKAWSLEDGEGPPTPLSWDMSSRGWGLDERSWQGPWADKTSSSRERNELKYGKKNRTVGSLPLRQCTLPRPPERKGLVPGESVIRATPEGPPTSQVHHETCRGVNGGPRKKDRSTQTSERDLFGVRTFADLTKRRLSR